MVRSKNVPPGVYVFSSDGIEVGKVVQLLDGEVVIQSEDETVRLPDRDLAAINTGRLELNIDAQQFALRPHHARN